MESKKLTRSKVGQDDLIWCLETMYAYLSYANLISYTLQKLGKAMPT